MNQRGYFVMIFKILLLREVNPLSGKQPTKLLIF